MIRILVDHDIEGQAALLWTTLATEGWLALETFQLITFREVALALDSTDRVVWRFAQVQGMLLLTGNRNMEGEHSLEQTIRDENATTSLPVVTIANLKRMVESSYRAACATRLAEIGLYLDNYLGTGRQFIP